MHTHRTVGTGRRWPTASSTRMTRPSWFCGVAAPACKSAPRAAGSGPSPHVDV